MTEIAKIAKGPVPLINSREQARALYAPAKPGFSGGMGIEVEMALYKPGSRDIPDPSMMDKIKGALHSKGQPAQLEVSGVIEYGSPAMPVAQVGNLIKRVETDLRVYEDVAHQHGYSRSPFSILPTTTTETALRNITNRPRLHAVVGGCIEAGGREAAMYHLFATSVQASFSPKDADEMFRMTYRGYALAPALIASMDNGSGYIGNDPLRHNSHQRMLLLEKSPGGGIEPGFLKSSTAQEHVDQHIDTVFKHKMLFAYGHDGEMIMPEKNTPLTFEKLAEKGLNTQTNYLLAQSFLYPHMKICNLTDGEGQIAGMRCEVRPADSGYHQPASVALITAALVPDGPSATQFDSLLKTYGFNGNPAAEAHLFAAAQTSVVHHKGQFMDVPFGTGSLREFAADVASILESHYDGQKIGPSLSKVTEILLTGESDAKQHAHKFGSLDNVSSFLHIPHHNAAPVHAAPQLAVAVLR